MNIKLPIKRKNLRNFKNNEPFDISFGSHNPFRKGEIIQASTVDIELKVVKVYDDVWWRKLLIKWKILKPIYLTKVIEHDK